MPVHLTKPSAPNAPYTIPQNIHQLILDSAQYTFGNKKKEPDRFEMRKIQYEGDKYLQTLLEEEIHWLEPKSKWTETQLRTFNKLIDELNKLASNPQSTAYVGRFNFEPEVNSYFYCELDYHSQSLKMEIFQRCD